MSDRIRFLLVDALNLIRRVYAAQPGEDGHERVEGARDACVRSLQRALRESGPTHAVCVFEGEGPSWRHLAYADYKAGRSPMPRALAEGLADMERAFHGLGVPSLRVPSLEADDAIATLAAKAAAGGGLVIILSSDKMFLQLLSSRVLVRDHFGQRQLDASHVKRKFAVRPEQFVDFIALSGDSTNNIPGVTGVGRKTAARLLESYGSLDAILASEVSSGDRAAGRVKERAGEALEARKLATLRTDLALGVNLRDFRCRGPGQG